MDTLFSDKNNSNKSGISFSRKKTPKKAEKIIRVGGDTSLEYLSVKRDRCNLNDQFLSDDDKKFMFTKQEREHEPFRESKSPDRYGNNINNNYNNSEDQIFSTRNLDLNFFSKKSTPDKKIKETNNKKSTMKKVSKNETQSQNLTGAPLSQNNFIQYTSSTINKYFVIYYLK